MPLGFSIIGYTVACDLFLRWATQGPLGPLVYAEVLVICDALFIELLESNTVWTVSYRQYAKLSL